MKTTKALSTISYNSDNFLTLKLNELLNRRLISFWCYIQHLPEDDEKKAHKHLFIIPNGKIDTDQLQDYLIELNPLDIEKPFGCLWFQSSKFGDWYFYELHDKEYLLSKGQTRKYQYNEEEFVYSSQDYFIQLKHQIDYNQVTSKKTKRIITAIEDGATLVSLLSQGLISPNVFLQWEKIYNSMHYNTTYRNDRATHTPLNDTFIDLQTGEVDYDPKLAIALNASINDKSKK